MSRFEAKNNLSNPQMFEERLDYKQKAFTIYDPVPLDMIYEKPFYGKVDKEGRSIYPTEINMTQLPGQGLLLLHDFATKAFVDLKGVIDFNIRTKTQRFANLFPNGFVPRSATKSMHKLYQEHFVDNVYDTFINDYVIASRKSRIRTFPDFVKEFVNYTSTIKNIFPVSRTGFIMSPFCPHAISGLIVEIADMAMDDDTIKDDEYLSKEAFTDYARLAAAFGFYVDKNCPWRLAVNVDHPVTANYMAAFGTSYKDGAVFKDYFYRSEFYSYDDFKARMWYAYKSMVLDADTTWFGILHTIKNCAPPTWADVASGQFKTIPKEGFLEDVSDDFDNDFQKNYPDSFFLPYYFNIRLIESQKEFTARQHQVKLKKILRANSKKGIEKALELLEGFTQQSNIYVTKDGAPYPRRIKYFGKSVTSGLHSYEEPVKVTLYGEVEDESAEPTLNDILEAQEPAIDPEDAE